MPKWTSPLFTDARNALGRSVVFSAWKGRSYFRSYAVPANPKTCKQRANRDVMKNLVGRYQSLSGDPDVKAAWNAKALDFQLSGFNLFTKWGMLCNISCPSTGSSGVNFTITYDLLFSPAEAQIIACVDSGCETLVDSDKLEYGRNKTVSASLTLAKTYTLYIANKTVLKSGDTAPQFYQGITCWSRDLTNCAAKIAQITIT